MTRVFIAAPSLALRAGLRAMLASETIAVVGEAVALSERAADMAGIDVALIGDEALLADAARVVADGAPAIVALAADERAATTLRGLGLRGWGVVAPEADRAELQAAVVAVAQGLVVLPPLLVERLFNQRPPVADLAEPLTAREREVLELLGQGLPNKLIAGRLQISEHTVKFHISAIFAKLGASSRTDAVSRGARQGLITL